MDVEFAFLCDAATESGGKLNALGIGIDRLLLTELPQHHRRLTLVSRIAFDPEDAGDHEFRIELMGPDGAPVAPAVQAQLHIQIADPSAATRANVMIELTNPQFTVVGPHEAKVALDGVELFALPLEVSLRQPA